MSAREIKAASESRSKIGRLPFARRMEFNRKLRDGFQNAVLTAWLAERGVPGVNAENIRKYKIGRAYKQWLAEEEAIRREADAVEQSMRLAEALGGTASDKLKSVLAGKLYPLLTGISQPDEIKALIPALRAVTDAEKLELLRRSADQRDDILQLDREKFEEQRRRNAEARKTLEGVVRDGGLSPETLAKMEQAVKLL